MAKPIVEVAWTARLHVVLIALGVVLGGRSCREGDVRPLRRRHWGPGFLTACMHGLTKIPYVWKKNYYLWTYVHTHGLLGKG